MIGSQLDQATLDNLLLSSPVGSSYLYEVTLVLRLLKSFISKEIAPESSRDSYDATVMYLEVDTMLSKEEKMKVCGGLSYEKLSSKACSHLARNKNFLSKSAGQALITQQVESKACFKKPIKSARFSL